MSDIFKSRDTMPSEPGEQLFVAMPVGFARPPNLNDAEVVRVAQCPADARAVNAAAYPAYTAPSVRNLSPRQRGKHY